MPNNAEHIGNRKGGEVMTEDQTRRLSMEVRKEAKKVLAESHIPRPEEIYAICRDALHDLDLADGELSTMTQAVGLATTAVPDMEIDVRDPIGMMHRVAATVDKLRSKLAAAQATIEQQSAVITSLRKREQWMGNLLARIHRDGGHYISKHGWQKACEDAEEIVLKLRYPLEET